MEGCLKTRLLILKHTRAWAADFYFWSTILFRKCLLIWHLLTFRWKPIRCPESSESFGVGQEFQEGQSAGQIPLVTGVAFLSLIGQDWETGMVLTYWLLVTQSCLSMNKCRILGDWKSLVLEPLGCGYCHCVPTVVLPWGYASYSQQHPWPPPLLASRKATHLCAGGPPKWPSSCPLRTLEIIALNSSGPSWLVSCFVSDLCRCMFS